MATTAMPRCTCEMLLRHGNDDTKNATSIDIAAGNCATIFGVTEPRRVSEDQHAEYAPVRDGDHYWVRPEGVHLTGAVVPI